MYVLDIEATLKQEGGKMTKDEMASLQEVRENRLELKIGMLQDRTDRTLLLGYTCNRADWHVYIQDGGIRLYTHGGLQDSTRYVRKEEYDPQELVPDKRLYPETCDFEFCKLLLEMGVSLPFTTYNEHREPGRYYGEIACD